MLLCSHVTGAVIWMRRSPLGCLPLPCARPTTMMCVSAGKQDGAVHERAGCGRGVGALGLLDMAGGLQALQLAAARWLSQSCQSAMKARQADGPPRATNNAGRVAAGITIHIAARRAWNPATRCRQLLLFERGERGERGEERALRWMMGPMPQAPARAVACHRMTPLPMLNALLNALLPCSTPHALLSNARTLCPVYHV